MRSLSTSISASRKAAAFTKLRGQQEFQLHKMIVEFLHLALPSDAVIFHAPNGEARMKGAAGRLKAMGTLAGLPDLGIIYKSRITWIEVKAEHGYVSDKQGETIVRLGLAGSPTIIARKLEDVEKALWQWGIPMRARAA